MSRMFGDDQEEDEESAPELQKKRKRYTYSNAQLADAIGAVKTGENAFSVAKRLQIPYTTLRKKLEENSSGEKIK